MTIEDETGFANVVIFQNLFDKYRKEILQSRLIMVEGKLQIEGEVIHVIVEQCHDFSKLLRKLIPTNNENFSSPFRAGAENLPILTLAYPDEKSIPPPQNKRSQVRENAQEKLFPEARNFR
jgi:error-prone DNA polymerase